MAYVALWELTWPEADFGGRKALGLIPTGSVEQHGPHLPLATDSLIAAELGRLIADALAEPVVVAPVVPGGLSDHHTGFPGTVTFPEEVFGGIVTAYVEAFERMGIRDVAVFSAHGGNLGFLGRYAEEHARKGSPVRLIAASEFAPYVDAMFAGAREGGVEPPDTDVHAGAVETSQGLTLFPQLVRPVWTETVGYTAGEEGWFERLAADGLHAVTANGVLGDPSRGRVEAGPPVCAAIAAYLVRWIADGLGYTPLEAAAASGGSR